MNADRWIALSGVITGALIGLAGLVHDGITQIRAGKDARAAVIVIEQWKDAQAATVEYYKPIRPEGE